ncbi:MAG TPA: biopolymer transporter ExbD [bacterium]|jgi:biopolymer transport protein ExbD
MAAPKKRRIPISIDMTPMVDIAFLLLIFFMSTTVFKKPEEVPVQLPASHSVRKLPETGVIVITIPKKQEGESTEKILMTLENAALDYDNGLSQQNPQTGKISGKPFVTDSLPTVIKRLLIKRLVSRVVIKADKVVDYGTVESVLETLQKNDLNIVNFVTDLKGDVPKDATKQPTADLSGSRNDQFAHR